MKMRDVGLAGLGALFAATVARAAAPALPHLDDLAARFGARPDVGAIALSPSGDAVLVVAPASGTRSFAVVHEIASNRSKLIIGDKGSEFVLRGCDWKTDTRLICTLSAASRFGGTLLGYGRVVSLDRDGKRARALGRVPGQNDVDSVQWSGQIIHLLPDDPAHALMVVPERTGNGGGVAVKMVDIATNAQRTVEEAHEDALGYLTDGRGRTRVRLMGSTDRGGILRHEATYAVRAEGGGPWMPLGTTDIGATNQLRILGFDTDPRWLLALKPKDGRQALYRLAADASGREEVVFANERVDVEGVLRIGKYGRPVAAEYTLDAHEHHFFDPALERLAASLSKALPDHPGVEIVDESWDGGKKLVFAGSDTDPGRFYLYTAKTHELHAMFDLRPQLANHQMAAVQAITYAAADGTPIPAYLTLPVGHADARGLPALLMPHGGPASRDERGFDFLPQFFAAMGYAVLQPNFRGSGGYGEAWFVQNGFKSWKIAMGDINDGARWLLGQGADKARLGIFGWSYGGYAALQANVLHPGLYKAAVAVAPVTDLPLLKAEAEGFSNSRLTRDFIGKGPHLIEGSPSKNAAKIEAPVLIFQGDHDLNVDPQQAHRMDGALNRAGKPHQLIMYSGLDHQLADGDARADMLRRSAAFFGEHLHVSPAPNPK